MFVEIQTKSSLQIDWKISTTAFAPWFALNATSVCFISTFPKFSFKAVAAEASSCRDFYNGNSFSDNSTLASWGKLYSNKRF